METVECHGLAGKVDLRAFLYFLVFLVAAL